MKWDFWHVVLALAIAIVAALLVIKIILGVVGFLAQVIVTVLWISVIVGAIYLVFRLMVHRRA